MGAHRHFYKRKGDKRGEQVYYNCTRHYATRPAVCPSRVNIYERDVEQYVLERLEDALEQCAIAAEVKARTANQGGQQKDA